MTVQGSAQVRPARFLFAMFQGGGNIPLILPIVAQLVERGHSVRVLAGPGVRANRLPVSPRFVEGIAAAGAAQIQFQAPETHPLDGAPPSRGVIRGWSPRMVESDVRRATVMRWAPVWAENVAAELQRDPADVVVADFELYGALAAAEAAGVPSAVLVHNVPWRPTSGTPPRGPGFLPAVGPAGWVRDLVGNLMIGRIWQRDALPIHNRVRAELELQPLRSPFEQFDRAGRVLVLTSQAFDFTSSSQAANVRYVGTPFDDAAAPADMWQPPEATDDAHPLVLVSLSTLAQGQAPVMHRVLAAVGSIPAHFVVTLGPSLDPAQFTAPPNVSLETFVPHAAILPHVSAVVTQCGLGTLMKALAHKAPVVCIPLVGDQPDNAARVVARGAGVRLGVGASPEQIEEAIRQVLNQPSFREAARQLGAQIAARDGAWMAADELEALIQTRR